MGSTTSFKPRKATFVVTTSSKHGRVFVPVNKRAKTVAKKLGKRTKITVQELRSTNGKGTYKFYQYTDNGLQPIKF